jgi:hypothetical protein
MATIVFNAVGAAIGGPIGGAVGALLGRQVDGALFGPARREGPRLAELSVTTSTYGQPLPRHFGKVRTAGSIIWGADLSEHSETQGTGKGGPAVTTYSYTASFAVALASRPILRIGRTWADGKLLRGAAGDLKAGGTLRIYRGEGDELADPLLIAAEGAGRCPAYRGLAYVVFEDLDLSDFYNRIPALTFEVIADESFDLSDIIGTVITDVDAAVPLPGIEGFTCEGPLSQSLGTLGQVFPLAFSASGERLIVADGEAASEVFALDEPTVAADDDGTANSAGYARRRTAPDAAAPSIVRYYDTNRDYLPGLQRASGRKTNSEAGAIELPASLSAEAARALIEKTARRIDWSREQIAWRTAELDPRISPGSMVTLPSIDGRWRVTDWDWQESGIELSLERAAPRGGDPSSGPSADPGRLAAPRDALAEPTVLVAYELPLVSNSADTGLHHPFAAVSSASPDWPGCALYADKGDGALHPLGPSGRVRSVIGTAASVLPPANPLLFDRASSIVVTLVDPAMQLAPADLAALTSGANMALIGEEIVQFMRAAPLGEGSWRIEGLLRGLGGTEAACATHGAGEPFVLLNGRSTALDPALLGALPGRRVVALGRGDVAPVTAPVLLQGVTLRPLAPVHARFTALPGGGVRLSWTRRARGAWEWRDGMDVPLVEQEERYLVTLGDPDSPAARWSVTSPWIELSADDLPGASGLVIHVQQQGTHALSSALPLFTVS